MTQTFNPTPLTAMSGSPPAVPSGDASSDPPASPLRTPVVSPVSCSSGSKPSCDSTGGLSILSTTVPPPPPHESGGKSKAKPRRRRPNRKPASSGGVGGKLMHLVVDSGAVIKGAGMTLANASENFWTVPEVVAEIRDKKARHHLETLPFELKLREPSDEAMKFAASFARQTGDLRSLSRVDLKVIALAYMLERQETGAAHLRTKPVRPGTKVNSRNKGIARTTLAAEAKRRTPPNKAVVPEIPSYSPASKPAEASTIGAAPTVSTTSTDATGVSSDHVDNAAPSGGGTTEQKKLSEGEKEGSAGVDSLCAAVKQAWTTDVVRCEERQGEIFNQGVSSRHGENVADGSANMEEEYSDREGTDGSDEDEAEGDEEEKEVDDDDEWEPEDDMDDDNTAKQKVESQPERSVSFAASTTEAGSRTMDASFAADDFPALGGGPEDFPALQGSGEGRAEATPMPAVRTAAASSEPPASSWSLMARSNPAPFKSTVRADPAPLPAATPLPEVESDPADHFSAAATAGVDGGVKAAGKRPDGGVAGSSRILKTASGFGVTSGVGKEEDDGEGWVNPSNFENCKMVGIGLNGPSQSQQKGATPGAAAGSRCRAGCVTTDFAMQNVILQVGLPLLSLDGMAVRRVKQWILRCSACFKTCTEMGRLFCPVCGNASMDRVACSVDAKTGETRVHLRKNHKVNLRGTKYSIPSVDPSKGRFEGDLLLREDQLLTGIWAQKARRKEKDISSMFGEDITGNVGLIISKSADIVVGYGRKNPNSARGRERRGKKSVKKRL